MGKNNEKVITFEEFVQRRVENGQIVEFCKNLRDQNAKLLDILLKLKKYMDDQFESLGLPDKFEFITVEKIECKKH